MSFLSAPFRLLGGAAIIGGGLIAAAIAHRPTQPLVWVAAYLVLVVGVAQYALGAGQTLLSARAASAPTVWGQWALLNVGHAGVMAGTLAGNFGLLAAGTILYGLAVAWLGWRVRGGRQGIWLLGYRALIVGLLASSLAGLALSTLAH